MKSLLHQIEQAFEAEVLPEFISDFINSGSGKLSDIKDIIKDSTVVQEQDVDRAIKHLEMHDMLPNKIDPYSQFVEIYNAAIDEEDFIVKNMLAAVYFPHMGDSTWDNAYEKVLNNFETLKQEKSERALKYEEEKKKRVDKMIKESLDGDIMTISDLLSSEIDNVSDDGIDEDIALFKFIARKLGVKDYDKLYIAVDDGNYNPEWILEDGLMLPYLDHKLFMYPSTDMIAEMHPNGNIFMYFVTEESANNYFKLAEEFLDDTSIDEHAYDHEHAQEFMERHPHGWYNNESDYGVDIEEGMKPSNKRWGLKPEVVECSLSTLEETLNTRDKATGNKFDLLNLYLKEHFSLEARKQLVEEINKGASDERLKELMSKQEQSEDAVLQEQVDVDFEEEMIELVKTNGFKVVKTEELDKVCDWLVSAGIDYDIERDEDEYKVSWYVGVDSNTNDTNVKLAEEMRHALSTVIELLEDIANSNVPAKTAMLHDEAIKETLREVLLSADKFDY